MNMSIRNPEMEQLMRQLAAVIKDQLPEGWGFNLFLFQFGENGALFYISDAERSDVINAMKEYVRRNTQ